MNSYYNVISTVLTEEYPMISNARAAQEVLCDMYDKNIGWNENTVLRRLNAVPTMILLEAISALASDV